MALIQSQKEKKKIKKIKKIFSVLLRVYQANDSCSASPAFQERRDMGKLQQAIFP